MMCFHLVCTFLSWFPFLIWAVLVILCLYLNKQTTNLQVEEKINIFSYNSFHCMQTKWPYVKNCCEERLLIGACFKHLQMLASF